MGLDMGQYVCMYIKGLLRYVCMYIQGVPNSLGFRV